MELIAWTLKETVVYIHMYILDTASAFHLEFSQNAV